MTPNQGNITYDVLPLKATETIAQWEFARPNLDLPNIEARSEMSA